MGSVATPPAGHFSVLYFAAARSYTVTESESFGAPLPLNKLFGLLEERHPGIKEHILSSCLVTINLEYVDVPDEEAACETVISEGDEVAIIPPVSSG